MRRIAALRLLATLPLLAACGLIPGSAGVVPDGQMKLSVANGTDLRLELVVNQLKIANVAPKGSVELGAGQLPQLPWATSVRFPDGRVLLAVAIRSGDVIQLPNESKSVGARVDLSCGRIDIWSGSPPSGPPPGPGVPGDCLP